MKHIKNPCEYLEAYYKSSVINKKLEIVRCTNPNGKNGWYQLRPFSLDVGHWSKDFDHFTEDEINKWNEEAKRLCSYLKGN